MIRTTTTTFAFLTLLVAPSLAQMNARVPADCRDVDQRYECAGAPDWLGAGDDERGSYEDEDTWFFDDEPMLNEAAERTANPTQGMANHTITKQDN